MIEVRIDETAYSEVAKGLIRRVVRSLINNLADRSVISLTQDLSEYELDLIYTMAFGVFVQFEDLRGHVSGNCRHPVVVGFTSFPAEGAPDPKALETILVSRRRTDLHGGIDDNIIRSVFRELQSS